MRCVLRMAMSLVMMGPLVGAGEAGAAYPERPVSLIVPFAAGGGTDATGRMIASLLEEELGVPVNVVNRAGGSGVVGHTAIANAAPDGYTIGVITVGVNMMHWSGISDLTHEDFTTIALYNEDPAGLHVAASSPWQTARELVDAIREAEPGELRASGDVQGGIWQLALAGMLMAAGIEPTKVTWVPSQGAAPGLQELAAGGVEMTTCSVPEAQALREAGVVRSLAVMADRRNPAAPDVPTLKEAAGLDWDLGAWRGIGGPRDLPQEVLDVLVPALRKIHKSEAFRDLMEQRGFGLAYAELDEFRAYIVDKDDAFGAAMRQLGLAKQ
jgi:tripartite-type tricarboxylate transporter receptor subunit TctC